MKTVSSVWMAAWAALGVVAANAAVLEKIAIPSAAMGKEIPANVILPDKYARDPGANWPTVYILHGANGTCDTYATDEVKYLADTFDIVFVCPDGGRTSWWFDSPIDPAYRYETHVVKEVVPYIDSHYRVHRSRSQRAVMGGSMGGHGACWLGFRHHDVFGAVGNIYGGVDLCGFAEQFDIKLRLGPLAENPERWRAHSAITEAAKLRNRDVELITVVGTRDFFLEANRRMHELLASNNVAHTYIEICTQEERTSGHSGGFNAQAKPLIASFFRNYFDTGRAQMVKGVYPLTVRYGARVYRAHRGESSRSAQVKVPPPWKLVEGDEGVTGCDSRLCYFTVEIAYSACDSKGKPPPPEVEVVWPGVEIGGVDGARNVVKTPDGVKLTPTAACGGTGYLTSLREGSIHNLFYHHVEGAQHGPYGGKPLPWTEINASANFRAAARAAFKLAGLGELSATEGANINLYGFDSNFPRRHVDHPPHFHIMLEWNHFRSNNVGHYLLGPDGRILANHHLAQSVPGVPEGYHEYRLGESTAYVAPSGRTLFTVTLLADGSGIVLARPGLAKSWKLASETPAKSVALFERTAADAPWTRLGDYRVSDDTERGEYRINDELFRYHRDTGKLR